MAPAAFHGLGDTNWTRWPPKLTASMKGPACAMKTLPSARYIPDRGPEGPANDLHGGPRPYSVRMPRPAPPADIRSLFVRYAVAWLYLAAVCLAELVYSTLPRHDQDALLDWASTNVHNLTHDPVGSIIVSAFFPVGALLIWPVIIALTVFGANAVLGNWRTLVTCGAGHVVGTLVSEGILWYRIVHGTMPAADRLIQDVGTSYVVVAAIGVALLWGSWLARAASAAAFLGLIVVGQIFSGLARLAVAPVGHVTALFVGCTLGSYLAWQRRQGQQRPRPAR
jgi:hypothetical protein